MVYVKTLLLDYLRENIKMRCEVQSLDTPARRSQEMSGGNTARKFLPRWLGCSVGEIRVQ